MLLDLNFSKEPVMENIIEQPNESFNFSNITLAHPTGIQGGSYFTKIEYNRKPLYIQTTKSLTRQGIVKTGKKFYCDLMFNNESESLINWFENLEDTCQKLIYSKSESWFQNALEISDIETAFNSTIRVYKSGKYYLVRTNIKNSPITNEPVIKIYDENEIPLTINDLTNETNIISILEIQGIKFSTRNFQIEIELKQVMVLKNEPLFDNCLIKTNKLKKNDQLNPAEQNIEVLGANNSENIETKLKGKEVMGSMDSLEKSILDLDLTNIEDIYKNNVNTSQTVDESFDNVVNTDNIVNIDNIVNTDNIVNIDNVDNTDNVDNVDNVNDIENDNDNLHLEIEEIEELNLDNFEEKKELTEFDLDNLTQENNLETITLKKPNQVYFDLYKEARKKAKVAKKMAILAYLEAKNIKKNYIIENLNDSESDFDAEIDEVSESELEGL